MFKIEQGAKRNKFLIFINNLFYFNSMLFIILLVAGIILFLPMLFIWSLNILFNLHIINQLFTKEWLAALIIIIILGNNSNRESKK